MLSCCCEGISTEKEDLGSAGREGEKEDDEHMMTNAYLLVNVIDYGFKCVRRLGYDAAKL